MRKWFLASKDGEPNKFLFYTEEEVEVIEGQSVPSGSVMAHLKRLPKGNWTVTVSLAGDERESFAPLLDGLKSFDTGFEPFDTHTFGSRPGFVAVVDMLIQIATTN